MDNNYYNKYLKYKQKYFNLIGGAKNNNNTYIDFITKDSEKLVTIDYTNDIAIEKILKEHFNGVKKLVCMDFHGVTDLYKDDEKIPCNLPKCVISYIGGNPQTIKETFNTIRPRVLSGEIILGIIVYTKDKLPSCGTKGWIISKIKEINNMDSIQFIDDSYKNIKCVKNIRDRNIITHFIDKKNRKISPKEQLNEILQKLV